MTERIEVTDIQTYDYKLLCLDCPSYPDHVAKCVYCWLWTLQNIFWLSTDLGLSVGSLPSIDVSVHFVSGLLRLSPLAQNILS